MGFNFISDQPDNKMVDSKTVLSVKEIDNTTQSGSDETMDLTQAVFAEGEEEQLSI